MVQPQIVLLIKCPGKPGRTNSRLFLNSHQELPIPRTDPFKTLYYRLEMAVTTSTMISNKSMSKNTMSIAMSIGKQPPFPEPYDVDGPEEESSSSSSPSVLTILPMLPASPLQRGQVAPGIIMVPSGRPYPLQALQNTLPQSLHW